MQAIVGRRFVASSWKLNVRHGLRPGRAHGARDERESLDRSVRAAHRRAVTSYYV